MAYLPAILYIMSNYLQKGRIVCANKKKFAPFDKEFNKEESEMKKVLSIVLSLAMVVCMMPLTAFAASSSNTTYSDIAGENCEGAVNVLSALGLSLIHI